MRGEEECWIALHRVKGLGMKHLESLMQRFGSPSAIMAARAGDLHPLSAEVADQVCMADGKKELLHLRALGGFVISYWDAAYPALLRNTIDPPWLLYGRGNPELLNRPSIAIVGTRTATPYGLSSARLFAREVAANEVVVISGLARGIDTAAHEGALESGHTIACLGSGLMQLYPKENLELAERIAEKGLLISEVPPSTAPARYLFPRRNRIISGMSLATLLVEAPEDSGAVRTMELAESQGRKLFALPGRWDMPSFQANHSWIRKQRAVLVENPRELLSTLPIGKIPFQTPAPHFEELELEQQNLLRLMPAREITLDELALLSALPLPKVAALLTDLLLKGRVEEIAGNRFALVRDG